MIKNSFSLLLLFCGLISQNAFANTKVSSQYAFAITHSELLKLLDGKSFSGQESQNLGNMTLEAPYKTILESIRIAGQYMSSLDKSTSPLDYVVRTQASQIRIDIQKITTDAVIYRNVGGVNVQVFLKGYCENLSVQSQSDAQLTTNLHFDLSGGVLDAAMVGLATAQIPQWQVSVGNCVGPSGYADVLREEIVKLLSDKDRIGSVLSAPISNKIKDIVKTMNESLFRTNEVALGQGHKVRFTPSAVQFNADHNIFVVTGKSEVELQYEKQESSFIDDADFQKSISGFTKSGLYFSQKWLRIAILTAKTRKLLNYTFLSSDIAGLQSLFSNRFYQFFVWPDLFNFSSNVPFVFTGVLNKIYDVSFINTIGNAVWYNVDGNITVNTQAPRDGQYMHYGDFYTPLKGWSWIQVANGTARVGIYNPQVNLQFTWDSNYVRRYSPSQSVDTQTFTREIQEGLGKQQYTVALPELKLSENLNLTASSISGSKEYLFVEYLTKDTTGSK